MPSGSVVFHDAFDTHCSTTILYMNANALPFRLQPGRNVVTPSTPCCMSERTLNRALDFPYAMQEPPQRRLEAATSDLRIATRTKRAVLQQQRKRPTLSIPRLFSPPSSTFYSLSPAVEPAYCRKSRSSSLPALSNLVFHLRCEVRSIPAPFSTSTSLGRCRLARRGCGY